MSGKKYKDKVEQRTKEEEKAMKAKVAAKKQDLMSELTNEVIRTYFDEDGVGDGKLFNRLHRDKIVGMPDLVERVIAKADAFAVASGSVIGRRPALEERLDACTTLEEVHAIAVDIVTPGGAVRR